MADLRFPWAQSQNHSFLTQQVIIGPCHEKTVFLHMRKQRRRSATRLLRAFVFATPIVQSLYFLNPKFQASNNYHGVCRCIAQFVLDLVGYPKDRVSSNAAHTFSDRWSQKMCRSSLTRLLGY